MDIAQILQALVASGPLAVVLGYWSYTFWSALNAERAAHDATRKGHEEWLKSLIAEEKRDGKP